MRAFKLLHFPLQTAAMTFVVACTEPVDVGQVTQVHIVPPKQLVGVG